MHRCVRERGANLCKFKSLHCFKFTIGRRESMSPKLN
jgi:hypothetical protein